MKFVIAVCAVLCTVYMCEALPLTIDVGNPAVQAEVSIGDVANNENTNSTHETVTAKNNLHGFLISAIYDDKNIVLFAVDENGPIVFGPLPIEHLPIGRRRVVESISPSE